MKNYYDELEVSQKASKEVIEKAYKVLAKKYHPDMNEDKKMAEEKFKKISEAYETLSDDEKRKNYDLELRNEEKNNNISYEQYMKIIQERNAIATKLNNLQNAVDNYNRQIQNNQESNRFYNANSRNNSNSFYYKFETFKRNLKKKFENLFILILAIVVILLMINAFSHSTLLDLFNI